MRRSIARPNRSSSPEFDVDVNVRDVDPIARGPLVRCAKVEWLYLNEMTYWKSGLHAKF